jgi:ergothioneine biosynthesis protein EgtB
MRTRTAEPQPPSTLRAVYPRVRAATEALAAPLQVEDMVVQSMPDASPTKWHLAHTSWFFETFVLLPNDGAYRVLDERWAVLFNSYYHAAGERHPRPERGMLSRPTVEEVRAYRRHVDAGMERLLARADLGDELLFLVELGLNHEEQHQELLLTDVKHLLAQNPLEPAYRVPANGREWLRPAAPRRRSTEPAWSAFAGGLIEIGLPGDGAGFAFDNERPRHRRWCEPFELARAPVTCGQYLEFVESDGYRRPELWLSDGFDAVQRLGWEAPLHWLRAPGGWRIFTLDGARELDLAEPVCHVSLYEADAYARFRGARLPSEEEWEHAAAGERVAGNLLESGRLHPAPLAEPGVRLDQAFGDVWEWTASAYAPYPGFTPFAGSIGEYNGKWMSSRTVLRGGSCATPARHMRPTYRNFFGPEARWQFTGIRLARS